MKRYILSILIVSIMTLISYDAISCPEGYTSVTREMTIGDCECSVDLCVYCGFSFPGIITISSFRLKNPECNNSLNINQILEGIKAQVSNWTFILDVCEQLQAPPCNEGWSSPITFRWSFCWYKEKISYFDQDFIVYRACDYDNYCEETVVYCFDGLNYIPSYINEPEVHGIINCPDQFYPDPTEYNQPTPCFQIDTDCN